MIEISGSRVPLAMVCPASATPPAIRVETAGEAAALGTWVHVVLAEWIANGQTDDFYFGEGAAAAGVDPDEARMLAWAGWRCWEAIRHEYPDPKVEYAPAPLEADGVRLTTGGIDLHSIVGDQIRLLDWKTGYVSTDARDQLRAYAVLLLAEHPHCATVHASRIGIRDGNRDSWLWSADELQAWFEKLAAWLRKTDTYNPGAHCGYCQRSHCCVAKEAFLMQSVATLTSMIVLPTLPLVRAQTLADLLARAKFVEKAAALAKDLVRAEIQAAGGVMPLGDGTELTLTEHRRKQILWNDITEDITAQYVPLPEIAECLTASKTKFEAAVKLHAARGQKGARVTEFLAELEHAGCLSETTSEWLEHRKVTQQIEEIRQ